jgi:electron transport complex protein RnfB
MAEQTYKKLVAHLDREGGDFAPSTTGADVRLLQRLFTEPEAALALYVTFEQQDAQSIARRAGLPPAKVEGRLGEMARKGLLFAVYPADGPTRYQIWPFEHIYESQAHNLTPDLLQAVGEYFSTREKRPGGQSIPALRTIPVGKSLTSRTMALPYELVGELVKNQKHIAIAPCICRTIAGLSGKGCDVPEESCATFGDFADHAIRSGRARRIDQAELADWLIQANALNLVLQPSNSREIGILCSCCGCCCAVLRGLKAQDRPADVVASSFIACYDADACTGCHTCLDRCQMDALSADGEGITFDDGRCIGCGLCVSTCPSGALTLERKPGSEDMHLPVNWVDTWRTARDLQAGRG